MTTDPEEGRRQIEAMKPTPLKVGDKVRLKAGGARVMTVVALEDYDNRAACEWRMSDGDGGEMDKRDYFPIGSLVRAEPSRIEGA